MAEINIDLECSNPLELLGQGIRAYTLRDYNAAVEALSRASEIAVEQHGDDKHDSLGNIYLFYGKALLELSREEAEPLGDAVPRTLNDDSDDDDTEEERNGNDSEDDGKIEIKLAKKLPTPSEEKVTPKKGKKKDEQKTLPPEKIQTKEIKGDESKSVEREEVIQACSSSIEMNGEKTVLEVTTESSISTDDKPQTSSSKDDNEKAEETEEDPSDLQVAWEVLELAKIIFQRRGDRGRKELAEALITLGEVSLESENFESAIKDIREGLEIQKSIYRNDSRPLAETYYKLGIALSTNNQIDEAVENFNLSLDILRNKIEKLRTVMDNLAAKVEIEEIQSLIPEIEEKVADMKSFKEEALKKISESIEQKSNKFEAGSSERKPTDISHLVKRKRKLEDITEELESNPAKKKSQGDGESAKRGEDVVENGDGKKE